MTTDATARARIAAHLPTRRRLAWLALVANAQFVFVVAYYAFTDLTPTRPRYVLYGLLWVNVGALAIVASDRPRDASFRRRRRALAVATAYFGVLAAVSGLVGTGLGAAADGLRVAWLTPGFGPALVYAGRHVSLVLMPAYVVGYAGLAVLVYGALLETRVGAVGGLLGLVSCVSCTWPVLAAVAATLAGGGSVLAASALAVPYDLSTAVFLVTVALLYYRPGLDRG